MRSDMRYRWKDSLEAEKASNSLFVDVRVVLKRSRKEKEILTSPVPSSGHSIAYPVSKVKGVSRAACYD